MKNLLLLHNGNLAVKEWFYAQYPTHQIMPCFTVDWPVNKIESIKNSNNIICDITSADDINYLDLLLLKKYFHIVKVVSSHNCDLANLEDTWDPTTYDYIQWLTATMLRMSIADEVIFYKHEPFLLPSTANGNIVFSPGRCGTHVLMEIANVPKYYHHNNNLLLGNRFNELVDSANLYSILRRDLFKFTVSKSVMIGMNRAMLTTVENLEQNKKIINEYNPIDVPEEMFINEIIGVANFLDILIGLQILWQKQISFCYLEDLSHHFSNLKILKNPYRTEDIVKNYVEAVNFGIKYQPLYDQLLKQANSIFKLAQF